VLVDTHCHLDFNTFDPDRDDVLSRARQAGVNSIINPGIDVDTSQAAVRYSEYYSGVFAAVGIHPNESAVWNESTIAQLHDLAGHSGVVAIGEIGLDYYREQVDHEIQKKVFRDQLALAASLNLPVIVHNRKSSDDLFVILSEWCAYLRSTNSSLAKRPGVLHSFEGDYTTADKFIKLNFFIGVGGPVTYKNARHRQALVAGLPLERILLETDAPFLTPQPYRGRRNEPANIRIIAEQIASLKAVPLEDLAIATTKNAAYLFSREF
jgi:TatD DNase family protein